FSIIDSRQSVRIPLDELVPLITSREASQGNHIVPPPNARARPLMRMAPPPPPGRPPMRRMPPSPAQPGYPSADFGYRQNFPIASPRNEFERSGGPMPVDGYERFPLPQRHYGGPPEDFSNRQYGEFERIAPPPQQRAYGPPQQDGYREPPY